MTKQKSCLNGQLFCVMERLPESRTSIFQVAFLLFGLPEKL
ncbi:hypothetical protein [Eikenella halliae]|nr:hypothetical protein [Eikenella halliae]